jgi:threonine/homoserine/homoserine lactone efflux protein
MVIVGGGAALTAIAVYLAFFALKSLRASRRARAGSEAERAPQ